eukprot:SAG11_NODE_232_length_11930_cov_6.884794_4_plen_146_part_00
MYDARPPGYDMSGYFSSQDGTNYAHVGVMGYMRVRWYDIAAFERVMSGGDGTDVRDGNPEDDGQCADSSDFSRVVNSLTATCCSESSPCEAGLPTVCEPACADALREMQSACANYLSTPAVGRPVRSALAAAAVTCQQSGVVSGH